MSDPIVAGGAAAAPEPWFVVYHYPMGVRAFPTSVKGAAFLAGSILGIIALAFGAAGLWLATGQIAWFIGYFLTLFPAFFVLLFTVVRARSREGQWPPGAAASSRPAPTAPATTGSSLVGIDHVQLAIPVGGEEAARPFYRDLLGLAEQPKPAELAGRGGAWFENGPVKVHLGVQTPFEPATKAHIAFRVREVAGLVARARAAGYRVIDDDPLSGFERAYIYDPHGNRLEFLRPLN